MKKDKKNSKKNNILKKNSIFASLYCGENTVMDVSLVNKRLSVPEQV